MNYSTLSDVGRSQLMFCLVFLDTTDLLLGLMVTSKYMASTSTSMFVWQLNGPNNTTGVAGMLRQQGLLKSVQSFATPMVPEMATDAGASAGAASEADASVSSYEAYVAFKKNNARGVGGRALWDAARNGDVGKMKMLISWAMCDIESRDQVSACVSE